MGDAEIIPIGTRGRPGRGTGSARPSDASRSLAGDARAGDAAKPAAPQQPADAGARADDATEPPADRAAGRADDARTVRRLGGHPAGRLAGRVPDRGAARCSATTGSRSWREFLAFLRRRLTGDYDVDEYGFDPEVTEQFLLAALRPIAAEVVPDRGPRRREHPGRGRRAGGLQPLRHAARSTA